MNKRRVSIIDELDKTAPDVTISSLAKKFQVSQRTIRNDLNAINDLLSENQLKPTEIRSGGRIFCGEDFEKLLLLVSEEDFYAYKLSKEERIRIASSLLVSSSEYITLSSIAESLFVSRATVIHDLDEMKRFVKEGNLQILSHPNKGLRVEGLESDKRLFLMKLAGQRGLNERQDVAGKTISLQAGNRIIVQKIVNEQEHIHACFFTDSSFHKILLYLGIMINRNLQGEYIEEQKRISNSKYYMAQDMMKYIVQYCHITTTENEIRFLSELLAKARYLKNKSAQNNVVQIQMITRQFIGKLSDELGINLNDDYDFFESLSNHLSSVFSVKEVSYPENSVIDEIVAENQDVLMAVNKRKAMIQSCMKRELAGKDLEYIAVHVCAALERKKNKGVAFHVIVACHAGIGTSRLLLEKLKTHFHFQIVDVVSSHEAKNLEEGTADFVISTIPLEGCKLDYVVVSPMLNDEDYVRVGNKIDALKSSRRLLSRTEDKEITAKGMIERLTPIVWETVPGQAALLMKKMRRTIRDYFHQSIEAEAEIFSPYLHHLLNPSHITLEVECRDWREAVRISGEKLMAEGYIEKRYIDAMIRNIEEHGPYVVLSPGFAVPHEGLEAGSIKVGMHLIRLKTPVCFGNEEFDPVEFVCCLSAVDHKTHLKAFFNLVNMLQTKDFKEKLHQCSTSAEASRIIEMYEYEVMG